MNESSTVWADLIFMTSYFFPNSKTIGTDQLTVRKDDKTFVLVEQKSLLPKEDGTSSTTSDASPEDGDVANLVRKMHSKLLSRFVKTQKLGSPGFARLPELDTLMSGRKKFRFFSYGATSSATCTFTHRHLYYLLSASTSVSTATNLFSGFRLHSIKVFMSWLDDGSTAEGKMAFARIIPGYTGAASTYTKPQTVTPAIQSTAGGVMIQWTPPKNSEWTFWHSGGPSGGQASDTAFTLSDCFTGTGNDDDVTAVEIDMEYTMTDLIYTGTSRTVSAVGGTLGNISMVLPATPTGLIALGYQTLTF
jgi:hypothetical protein